LHAIQPDEPIIERPADWAVACWALAASELELDETIIEEIIGLAGKLGDREAEIYDLMEEIDLALAESETGLSEEEIEEGVITQETIQRLQEYASQSFDALITIGLNRPEEVMMLVLPLERKIHEQVEADRAEHAIQSLEKLIKRMREWEPEDRRSAQSRVHSLEFLYEFLARTYQDIGQHMEAVRTAEAGLKDADAPMLWERLGHLRDEEGNFEEAVKCWWRAVRLNPADFDQVLDAARVCMERERFDEAEEFLQAALDCETREEGEIELMDLLAEVYERKGDTKRAQAAIEELLQEQPLYDQQIVLWTKRAMQTNRKIQALNRLKEWAEGTRQVAGIPTAHLLLALLYLDLGKEKQVRQRLRQWKETIEARGWLPDVDWELLQEAFPSEQVAALRTYLD
jgi:tetratricopeptide (TPR) repeat protein